MKKILFSWAVLMTAVYMVSAQVIITQKSSGSGVDGSAKKNLASDTGILLKLEAGAEGGALLLPRLTDKQKEAMGIDLPEGMFIYEKEKHRLEIFAQKKGMTDKEWKPLGFGADSEAGCEWVQITNSEVSGFNGTKADFTISLTKKSCLRKKDGRLGWDIGTEGVSSSTSDRAMPGTKLVYNGLTLNAGRDYTVTLEEGTDGGNKKVKITFTTLIPESFDDFDVFMVEYQN